MKTMGCRAIDATGPVAEIRGCKKKGGKRASEKAW